MPPAAQPIGEGNDSNMLPTWAWQLTLAWAARGPLKVTLECDPGMRQEFASENKPINRKQSRLFHCPNAPNSIGVRVKNPNIVFSRGLTAARTGGVVAAIPCACHTVRRRQRKTLLPNNPPPGFSLGTVTTTERLSTEATPEHHRGCFNAPRTCPVSPDPYPSSPTLIGDLRVTPCPVGEGRGEGPPNPSSPAKTGTHHTPVFPDTDRGITEG